MKLLKIPPFHSGGLILSYQCSNYCRHCIYASSPRWNEWIDEDSLKVILQQIKKYAPQQQGLHIGGGEAFLNFEILQRTIELCVEQGILLQYVETNAFWCDTEEKTRGLFQEVRNSGLSSVLISASPFHNEFIPFEYTERAVHIATEIFGQYNVLVYTPFFFDQLKNQNTAEKLDFHEYLNTIGKEQAAQLFINHYSIVPTGRFVTKLHDLYRGKPATYFFNTNCYAEFTNPHHIHIDNWGNYIVSFCSGISLGNAFYLERLYQGINLKDYPLLGILSDTGVEGLLQLAKNQFDYVEREAGYIAKCHLCQDIRKHIVSITDQFEELAPLNFYLNL